MADQPETYRVKFKAGGIWPSSFPFDRAKVEMVPHGKTMTRKVIPAKVLKDGDIVTVDAFLRGWLCGSYPDNFTELKAAGKPKGDDE